MNRKREKGFTLMEVIAGLAIFTIVLVSITSMIITTFKYNEINKKTFDSNSMSKVFYETVRANRPSNSIKYPITNIAEQTYYIAFNSEEDLKNAIKDKLLLENFLSGGVTNKYYAGKCNYGDSLQTLQGKIGVSDKAYVIKIKMVNNNVEKVYELVSTTWNISKGEASSIERKSLIAIT